MMLSLLYPPVSVPFLPRPTAADHLSEAVPETGGEMLPVVDETGVVTAEAPRSYCHKAGLRHPVVHLHLINRYGDLFLQKRSLQKECFPGRWDTAVGGHVGFGESLEAALFRESSEELDFISYNPITLQSYIYEGNGEKEWVAVYAAVGNFHLDPHNDEVSEGKWWKMQDIEDNLGKSVFTPIFEQEFGKIRSSLEALL